MERTRKSIIRKIIFEKNRSTVNIPITTTRLKSYHAIDKKPLFEGAADYFENDSIVDNFLSRELLRVQGKIHNPIGLYLIIDENGKAAVDKVYYADEATENNLRNIVDNMPLFKPGEHKGEKVKVSYLVEIK